MVRKQPYFVSYDQATKKHLRADYPASSQDHIELARLQEFFQRMKDAGVARTRAYDLPRPDTLGRSVAAKSRQGT